MRIRSLKILVESNPEETEKTLLCRLDDGRIVPYDIFSFEGKSSRCEAHKDQWEYLGEGTIESINGTKQLGKLIRGHFYELIKP